MTQTRRDGTGATSEQYTFGGMNEELGLVRIAPHRWVHRGAQVDESLVAHSDEASARVSKRRVPVGRRPANG